jgi:hypothetical protein
MEGKAMPMPCSICTSPHRADVDRALIQSTPNRRIATQYGLTESAVRRHAAAHLPSTLVVASEAAKVKRADGLLEEAWRLQDEADALLTAAKKSGSVAQGAQALQAAQRGLALMATLRVQMQEVVGPQRYAIRWLSTPLECPHCGQSLHNVPPPKAAEVPPVIDAEVVESGAFAQKRTS